MKTRSLSLTGLLSLSLVLVSAPPTSSAAELKSDAWTKVSTGHKGHSLGAAWVKAPDLERWLLVGSGVQAFDPTERQWESYADAKPRQEGISPFYKAVYVPETKTIYCLSVIKAWRALSGETWLFTYNGTDKTWSSQKPAELRGLAFPVMAYDRAGERLVIVGSDKRIEMRPSSSTPCPARGGTRRWSTIQQTRSSCSSEAITRTTT